MRFFCLLFLFFSALTTFSQSVIGAWERMDKPDLIEEKSYMIITDGYVVTTKVESETGSFISTRLERWQLTDNLFKVTLEYDTEYPEAEGGEYEAEIEIGKKQLVLDGEKWQWIDDGSKADLSGTWKMVSTKWEGNRIDMGLDHPRRAIKILSGTRFQWIDYDKKSRTFSASAGGTYTFKDGKYSEHFEFFTNQPTWIGDSVSFTCKVENDRWYHVGSLPDEMIVDEIWRKLD